MPKRTFYQILQVSPDATAEVITSAWHTLMSTLKKHPDLGGDAEEAASINEAYQTLSDPKRRARYDAQIAKSNSDLEDTVKVHIERRRAERHDIDATVSYCIGHDLLWHPARIKDVSALGIRLQSKAPLEKGQHLVIAPSNLASTAIHGTVRWSRSFHPSIFERIYEAGIEFADQITDVEQRLSV